MQEITLKSLISWVKQNFPAKIIDEVSGAEVEVGKNKELQEKLFELEEKTKQIIEDLDAMIRTITGKVFGFATFLRREILGESDERRKMSQF